MAKTETTQFNNHDKEFMLGRGTSLFAFSERSTPMETILCVDDDPNILDLYKDEFSEEGYHVILAGNGQEALMKFESEKFDVVVMDIRMPRMDGVETLMAMLGKNRQVRVILNTVYPQYRDNFMTWVAEAYVIKSSDFTELKTKIREVLDRRKKTEQTEV
jgi:DNA-binding response OmpR family regulator